MRHSSGCVVAVIAVCLVSMSCDGLVANIVAAPRQNPSPVKRQVNLIGCGIEVKIKLAGGKQLEGVIGAIGAESFDLILRRDPPLQTISYDEVTDLKVKKSTYRASRDDRVSQARSVVAGLGAGRRVKVKVTSGATIRGNILQVDEDHFQLLPDRQTRPIKIVYGDVQEIGRIGTSLLGRIHKGVAIVAAVGVVGLMVTCGTRTGGSC